MLTLDFDITGLRGADYNPRHIDGEDLEKLAESIRELGLVKPLIVRGNLLVAGHQRTKALRLLGTEKAAVPRSNQFWIVSNSKDFVSPFNGATQTVSFPGSRWACSMDFVNLTEFRAQQLEVLIAQMKAGAKRV